MGGRMFAAAVSAVVILALTLPVTVGMTGGVAEACDLDLYLDATRRWLAGGPFYEPWQLAGPYPVAHGAILYPPVALWLFVPFVYLPAVLWWAIPAMVIAWSLWRLRPGPWTWPILAVLVGFSPLPVLVKAGNPALWAIAAAWAGAAIVGPSVLVLLKPSLAPFALFGAWRRRWWAWAVVFTLACLPCGAMWLDWIAALRNSDGSLFYSFREYGLLIAPAVAWLGRREGRQGA